MRSFSWRKSDSLAARRKRKRFTKGLVDVETRLAHRVTGLVRWVVFLWVTQTGILLSVLFAFPAFRRGSRVRALRRGGARVGPGPPA